MQHHGLTGKYFFYWSNLLHFIFSIKLVVTFFVLNQDNLLFALMQKVAKVKSRQTRLLRRFVGWMHIIKLVVCHPERSEGSERLIIRK